MATGKSKPTQRERFIDKARELGIDEDEAAFEARLKRVAKAGPQAPPAPKSKPKKKETD